MAGPTWTGGQGLSASDVNSWFVPLAAFKPSNTTISSNATLTADPDLVLAVAASAVYRFEHTFYFTSTHTTTNVDFKWDYTVPTSAEIYYQSLHNEGGAIGLNNSINLYVHGTVGFSNGNDSTNVTVSNWGILQTEGSSGNLTFR